jgi:dienelactone hydrolase
MVACLTPGAHAMSGHDRLEGPFGRGAAQVWLLLPLGAIRNVVVFGHGWKLFPPSRTHPWVGQFRPWLDHLAGHGAAVIFPRYQLGSGDVEGTAQVTAYEAGLRDGLGRLPARAASHTPVIAVGYSFGASLAFTYAANAGRWRLPLPAAVDAVFPAGMISGAPLPSLAARVRVLIQVGDRDSEAGSVGASSFWAWLAGHPPPWKRYVVVHSAGGFVATHAAPKEAGSAARAAFWVPLDALIATVDRE